MLEILKFNKYFSISLLVISYQIIYYISKYFNKNIFNNLDLISLTLLPTIFISVVVLFVDCNINLSSKIIILLVKRIFLISLILLAPKIKINFTNFIFGSSVLIIYYLISDINTIYNCNIENRSLLNSFIVSSIIYFVLYLIKK